MKITVTFENISPELQGTLAYNFPGRIVPKGILSIGNGKTIIEFENEEQLKRILLGEK